jgi:hypothetical protein
MAVLVLGGTAGAATWNVPGDFATIQEAIDSPDVSPGATILVGPGNHDGAYVTKEVELKGEGGAVINNGPLHPAGLSMGFRLLTGSDIAHLRTLSRLLVTGEVAVGRSAITSLTTYVLATEEVLVF